MQMLTFRTSIHNMHLYFYILKAVTYVNVLIQSFYELCSMFDITQV